MKSKPIVWEPCKSVGGVAFGCDENMLSHYDLSNLPDEEDARFKWKVYADHDDSIRVYCENGKVTSIAVYQSLFFQGVNLIGSNFNKVESIFRKNVFVFDDKLEMSDGVQTVWRCDELGAMFWLNDKSVVVSCSCDDGT